jgi:hypothetical protein
VLNSANSAACAFNIGVGSQTLSFGPAPSLIVQGTGTVSVNSNRNLSPIVLSSNTPSVCTLLGNTVTALTTGTCTIAANQAGNSNFDPATATQSISVTALRNVTGLTTTTGQAASASFVPAVGDVNCSFDPNNTGFVAAPAAPFPVPGTTAPHGFFKFKLVGCQVGSTVRMSVTWPSLVNMTYRKYGKAAQIATAVDAYYLPKNLSISGNTASFDVIDGGWGDNDLLSNGEIIDPNGPLAEPAVPVPSLNHAALLALLLLMLGLVMQQRSHRRLGLR